MSLDKPSTALTSRQQVAAVVLAAALVGVVLAPGVYAATNDPNDTVAVVEIEGPVTTALADDVESELADIRANDSVGAVVLKLDTPGGAPVASERMYKAVQRTSKDMTVIASVQSISASGGYYAMAPADEIYVLPTSTVGSIGLNAPAPGTTSTPLGPSGPDKAGSNPTQAWAEQKTLADTFIDAMMAERGEKFEMPREEVAKADVYLGTEAVQNGFADEIGSLNEAIHAAATEEELGEYTVDTRETGETFRIPFLVRTDAGIVAIHANDPGYADVKPMPATFVYWPAVPHVDTIERFSETDLRSGGATSTERGATGNSTARLTGGVGA
ncbi:S49 family peptidase [Halobacteriales archaeon SW_8_68_21]|nr:MAG: S49 family peptidase [Halobacteriales archaeon SW_8_68_21]